MWTKKLKRSFALPLVMVRNMIFDFLRKVECDGQKIVVESLIVGIQVYRNYKVIDLFRNYNPVPLPVPVPLPALSYLAPIKFKLLIHCSLK